MTDYEELKATLEAKEKELEAKKLRESKENSAQAQEIEELRELVEDSQLEDDLRLMESEPAVAQAVVRLYKRLNDVKKEVARLSSSATYRKKKMTEEPHDDEHKQVYEKSKAALEIARAKRDKISEALKPKTSNESALNGVAISQVSYPEHEPPTQSDFS